MISKAIIVLWSLFCAFGLAVGLDEIDSNELETSTATQIGTALGVFLWFFFWAAVVIPTALIGLLFKKEQRTESPHTGAGEKRKMRTPRSGFGLPPRKPRGDS